MTTTTDPYSKTNWYTSTLAVSRRDARWMARQIISSIQGGAWEPAVAKPLRDLQASAALIAESGDRLGRDVSDNAMRVSLIEALQAADDFAQVNDLVSVARWVAGCTDATGTWRACQRTLDDAPGARQ